MPLEIERKFLIKSPLTLQSMRLIWLDIISVDHIYQFYLRSDKGITRRLRAIRKFGSTEYKFIYTEKKNIAPGINEEEENEVSPHEYQELGGSWNAEKSRAPIHKTRYTFKHYDQVFELDSFEEELEGLVILEIELDSMDDKVELPPFLTVIKEVTLDEKYRNSKMAKLVKSKGCKAIKSLI